MLPTRNSFSFKDTHIESEWIEKHIPCKWKLEEKRGRYLYLHQTDFETKTIIRDKDGHYTMIKVSIHRRL